MFKKATGNIIGLWSWLIKARKNRLFWLLFWFWMILEFQRHPNILFYGWLLSNSRLMLECSSKPLKVMEELGFMEDSYPALMPNSWSKKARRWPWRLQKVKTTLIQTKIAKALPSTMITSRALFQGEICTTKARNLVKDFGTFSKHRQNILSGESCIFEAQWYQCIYLVVWHFLPDLGKNIGPKRSLNLKLLSL